MALVGKSYPVEHSPSPLPRRAWGAVSVLSFLKRVAECQGVACLVWLPFQELRARRAVGFQWDDAVLTSY